MTTLPHAQPAQLWRRAVWREVLSSSIWLLFLLFPIISVATTDLSTTRKVVAIGLIVLFAGLYVAGFLEQVRRHTGSALAPETERGTRWFVALVAAVALAFPIGGWPVLAVLPFVVSFAMFHFSWRTVLVIFATCLAISIIGPAAAEVLSDAWFFSVIIAGVAGATALIRIEEEHRSELVAMQTDLAVSSERNRVARDVHDVLGHSLTAVILKAQVCDRLLMQLEPDDARHQDILAQTREQLAELNTVSRRALSEIRSTVGGLRSAELIDELTAARAVLADAGVELTVLGDPTAVETEMRSTLGWVVREAVTNIVRHARASRCRIELQPSSPAGDALVLRITDDGIGLRGSAAGNGLVGLAERVRAAGAELRSYTSDGTVIEVAAHQSEARL